MYIGSADFTPGTSIVWNSRRRVNVDKLAMLRAWGLIKTMSASKLRCNLVLLLYKAAWKPVCMKINRSAKAMPDNATRKRLL